MRRTGRKKDAKGTSENRILLTQKQVAEGWQLSERALEAWRHRGGGPRFIRISRRCVRYRLTDLNEWINERLVSSTADPGPQNTGLRGGNGPE